LLSVKLAIHVNHAFDIVMVVEIRPECTLILNAAIVGVFHVATDDDSGSAIILHVGKCIECNLRVKTADFLAVIELRRC